VARDVADAVDVGDRGTAELHDETGHGSRSRSSTASAPGAAIVAGRREKARIDTGAMRRLQLSSAQRRLSVLERAAQAVNREPARPRLWRKRTGRNDIGVGVENYSRNAIRPGDRDGRSLSRESAVQFLANSSQPPSN
jgi:hypothetical protein